MLQLVDDRYELVDVLASGGMATVWRARDTRLNRLVALKRPHPAPVESKVHERMAREARAAAGVNHPNLVTMFDTGVDQNGPYLVMSWCPDPLWPHPGVRFPLTRRSSSAPSSPTPSPPFMRRASSIATSNRPTSFSPQMVPD